MGVAREYDATAEEGSVEEFLQQIALFSEQDNLRDEQGGIVTLMTLHNAKGLEYGIVFIIGLEDGVFPHMRSIEGATSRRSAGSPTSASRARSASSTSRTRGRGRCSAIGTGTCAAASSTRFPSSSPTSRRTRRGPAAAATWGGGAAAPAPKPAGEAASFALGEDVVHAQFGDGVVTGVEPGGLVVVRFAGDGSERKLMADYAPLKRR